MSSWGTKILHTSQRSQRKINFKNKNVFLPFNVPLNSHVVFRILHGAAAWCPP